MALCLPQEVKVKLRTKVINPFDNFCLHNIAWGCLHHVTIKFQNNNNLKLG